MNYQDILVHFSERERNDLAQMAKWFRGIGAAMLILGILAVILPHMATLTVQILVAVILLVSGAMHLAHAFYVRRWRSVTWEVLVAVVFLFTGLLFSAYPLSGIFALTLLLGGFFLIVGVLKTQAALSWRRRPGWILLLAAGLLSMLLGILLILGLPGTAVWAIGLILGIDLVVSGIALWTLGSRVRALVG